VALDEPDAAVQPTLDLEDAACLAMLDGLDAQLAGQATETAVVLDPRPLVQAVLALADAGPGRYPRIPDWTEPRTVGGARRGGQPVPEPRIRVEPGGPGHVAFTVTVHDPDGRAVTGTARLPTVDATGWLLAGLAACQADPG